MEEEREGMVKLEKEIKCGHMGIIDRQNIEEREKKC